MNLVAPWHVGSSQSKGQIGVPCIGRQILVHCTTREVPHQLFFCLFVCFEVVCSACSAVFNSLASQAPLSMEFSRQKYWSKLPFPTPGDLRILGIETTSLASPSLAGGFFTTSATWEALLSLEENIFKL